MPAFQKVSQTLIFIACLISQNSFAAGPEDRAELAAFFDGVWLSQKESHQLMGGVVTVVKDNKVIFNRGYGYADYAKREKVNPDINLFRIASISKPFTWTAVMQLVEAGELDLDTDINEYLELFQIPDTFPAPITMKHLMTHSAGFEDVVLDLGRRSADELEPLGKYLSEHLPRRVRAPGTYSSYSNHSTALAAYIVEIVSGKSWSEYIEQHILQPMSMNHTVARHPMPENLRDDLTKSYVKRSGEWQVQDFLYWFIYPAGMMSTTGSDMAKFMLAHLNNGEFNGFQLLQAKTVATMQSPLFSHFDGANAWLHGFYEFSRNGVRIFGHGGDLNAYHSNLLLFPDQNLGLFMSFNSEDSAGARSALTNAFINHYFPPAEIQRPEPPEDAETRYADYVGTYGSLRRNWSDFSKLALLVNSAKVDVNSDGYLRLSGSGSPTLYVEISEDLFQSMDSEATIKFDRDDSGEVTNMVSGAFASGSRDRLSWQDSPELHQALFACVAIISLLYIVYWPVRLLRRIYYHVNTLSLPSVAYSIAWLMCLGNLVSSIALANDLGDAEQFYFGIPAHTEYLLALVMFLSLLTAFPLIFTTRFWMSKQGSLSERINYSLFTLAAIVNAGLAWYWNTSIYHLSG